MPTSIVISGLLFAGQASAQEKLGLRDALSRAVKGNVTLAQEGIDVAIADANVMAAEGIDDWLLDASVGVSLDRTEAVEGELVFADERRSIALSGGLTRNLPTGGRVGLRVGQLITHTVQPDFLMGGTDEVTTFDAGVTLSLFHPLLRGFGKDVARAQRRRAVAQRTIEELERANVASEVIRDVVSVYWELAYAQDAVEIARQSLALAKEQLRITQARLDVGVGARTDLAAVEQTIAIREENVLLAELNVIDRALELRRLVGMEITATTMIVDATDDPEVSGEVPAIENAMTRALQNNPQLAIVRAQGDRAQIEVEVTENGLLPQLDFSLEGGPRGRDSDFGGAWSQLPKFDSYSVEGNLIFSMPIGNRFAKGQHEAAKLNLRKVKVGQADLEAQVSVAVARAVHAVASARKRLEVLETATRAAQVNLDAERARYDVGHSTNFDVLLRQDELANAQLRQARARADFVSAVANLQTLTGDILPAYGIEIRTER